MRLIIVLTVAMALFGCSNSESSPDQSPAKASEGSATYTFPMTFSASGGAHCANGACNLIAEPASCYGVQRFGDFTIYSENSATFFNSVSEPVFIQDSNGSGTITLTTGATGHLGLQFAYSFDQASGLAVVWYSSNCGRLYHQTN